MHEDIAAERLRAALADQELQTARYEQAVGTTSELTTFARLQAANLAVANCDRTLRRLDDAQRSSTP